MCQIFQQSKLKGCFWLLNKLTIITVAILSIILLMQDLMAEEQQRFWKIVVPYAMLFILNSNLLVKTIAKKYEYDGTLIYWLIIYAASMLLNCVGITMTNKYEYWIPVNSKTATEFIIFNMDLNPAYRLSIAFCITGIICMIMTMALLVTVMVDTIVDQPYPVLPTTINVRIRRPLVEQPPKYTSQESLPNYNTALQHEVVERA